MALVVGPLAFAGFDGDVLTVGERMIEVTAGDIVVHTPTIAPSLRRLAHRPVASDPRRKPLKPCLLCDDEPSMPTRARRACVPAVALAFALAGVAQASAIPPADLAPPGLEQAEIPVIDETADAAIHAPDEIVRTVEEATGVRVPDVTGIADEPGGSPVSTSPAVTTRSPHSGD